VLAGVGASFLAEPHGFRDVLHGFVHEFADPVCGIMAEAGKTRRRLRELIQREHADRGALRVQDLNEALPVAILSALGVRVRFGFLWFADSEEAFQGA